MNVKRIPLLSVYLLILILLLSACGNNDTATPDIVTTETTQQETAPATTQGEEQPTTESEPSGVPEDVPIMPEAYDLSVPNQLNVSYKVAVPITDVVAFYQQEFTNYGWDEINNPDSVIGSMAQLSRSNADGDRLIFSIQYNSIGQFSVVQIYIVRTP